MRAAALIILAALAALPAAADYLSPELRYRVEALKQAARAEPTSAENLARRIDVLWDWANAYALTGGPIPQDLPVIIRSARAATDSSYSGAFRRVPRLIDFYIWELALKDESPDAVPTLALTPRERVAVRSHQTFTQTLTIGSAPLRIGGVIQLGIDGFNDQGRLQTDDPAADNYVSIRASNPNAKFTPGPGRAGISLPTRIVAQFTLEGAELRQGDTVTITYGDRSGGSRGFEIQTYTVDQLMLPVYVDLEGKGFGLTLDWPAVELIGRPETARLNVVAPSIAAPGEKFNVSIRREDRFYNRASGRHPGYEVRLNGQPLRAVPAGDGGPSDIQGISIDQPGVYRFDVQTLDGRFSARSNPIWVRQDPPYRIYWGDTHAHTKYAEGQGSADGFYRFARDDARLDFVTLSEHDIWLDASEWKRLRELAESYHAPGKFIPILGYEWTVSSDGGGHHNVLFRDSERDIVGSQVTPVLTQLYEALKLRYNPNDVLTIPHAHQPGDWTTSDPETERLIEIASVHGTFEFFGNRYLQNGWKVGFVASTDNHHGHPGYPDTGTTFHTERNGLAAVMAKEKTRDSIFSAMRDIRAYAVSGDRIILDVEVDGRPIGSDLPADAQRRIAARVMGTAPIDTIDVVKNGQVIYSRNYATAQIGKATWAQLAFSSSSEVTSHRPPRNYRTWEGSILVNGATLKSFEVASFDNQHQERARRDPANPNRILFRTLTRGRSDVLLLELDGANESTTIHVETGASEITTDGIDQPEQIPAVDAALRLGEARDGRIVHSIELPSADDGLTNTDAITLQIFDPAAGLDRSFEFSDRGRAKLGDYYYVRATQIDGERAWSSPVWVGREDR